MSVDALDGIAMVDAVLIGVPVEPIPLEGLESPQVAWRFDVEAVVTGDVSADQVVVGHSDQSSCGPSFDESGVPVVVYANEVGGRLHDSTCIGADVDDLIERLDEVPVADGTGPPAAVRLGAVANADLALLDPDGQVIASTLLGLDPATSAAVCPGSTRVMLVNVVSERSVSGHVELVDLATMAIADEYDVPLPTLQPQSQPFACYDDGNRIVAASTVNPAGELRIVSGTATESITYEADAAVHTVAFHPDGTALLLPIAGGSGIGVLDVTDLSPLLDADVPLPDGTSVAAAAVSPDGTRLAMLANLDHQPAINRAPNTHVIVIDVDAGVPVAGTAHVVALPPESLTVDDAPALRIGWLDNSTWVLEHVGNFEDHLTIMADDGDLVLAPIDVGYGSSFITIGSGQPDGTGAGTIMRATSSGIRVISPEGRVTDGEPAQDDSIERFLGLTSLDAAAALAAPRVAPEPYRITYLDEPAPTTVQPALETPAPTTEPTTDTSTVSTHDDQAPVAPFAIAIGAAIVVIGVSVVRRRTRTVT